MATPLLLSQDGGMMALAWLLWDRNLFSLTSSGYLTINCSVKRHYSDQKCTGFWDVNKVFCSRLHHPPILKHLLLPSILKKLPDAEIISKSPNTSGHPAFWWWNWEPAETQLCPVETVLSAFGLCLPRRAHPRAVFSPREGWSPGQAAWAETLRLSRAHLFGCEPSSPDSLHLCWSQSAWLVLFIGSSFLHVTAILQLPGAPVCFEKKTRENCANCGSKEWRRSHDTKLYIPARKLN